MAITLPYDDFAHGTTIASAQVDANFAALAAATSDLAAASFTPAIAFGGATTGITYSSQWGEYVRIGDLVIAFFYIVLTSNGSASGAMTLTGLPVTAVNESHAGGGLITYSQGFSGLDSGISLNVTANTTTAAAYDVAATGSATIQDTNTTDSSIFGGFVIYRRA